MSFLAFYLIAVAVVGVGVVVVRRRERQRRLATPPWELWARGQRYSDLDRQHRTRAVAGGLLGVLVAIPVMVLIGFAGTAGKTRRY